MTRCGGFLVMMGMCCLVACTSYQVKAPVQDVNLRTVHGALVHTVQPGETLYEVAWRYDKDYRQLAELNHLSPPYAIHPGQAIQLNGQPREVGQTVSQTYGSVFAPHERPAVQQQVVKKQRKVPVTQEPTGVVKQWHWPIRARVAGSAQRVEKGVDISGSYGQAILAAANGKVVYAGDGVRGYGHLLLIKHNAQYLTAYAYNAQLMVQEGDWVKTGQVIAKMGRSEDGKVALHFEIRKEGQAVNPMAYF